MPAMAQQRTGIWIAASQQVKGPAALLASIMYDTTLLSSLSH